jgi:hypothetical protein
MVIARSNLLRNFPVDYDPVHVNAEFADQASDHDPQIARLDLRGRPSPTSPVRYPACLARYAGLRFAIGP